MCLLSDSEAGKEDGGGGGGSASEEMCCYHAELSGLWQSISHEVKLSPSFLSLSLELCGTARFVCGLMMARNSGCKLVSFKVILNNLQSTILI